MFWFTTWFLLVVCPHLLVKFIVERTWIVVIKRTCKLKANLLNGRKFELIWLDWAHAPRFYSCSTNIVQSSLTLSPSSPPPILFFVCSNQEIINSPFKYVYMYLFIQVNIIHWNHVGDPFFVFVRDFAQFSKFEFGKCHHVCVSCRLTAYVFIQISLSFSPGFD